MHFDTAKFLALADAKGRIENLENEVGYLIITLGIPGSGKTTWAKKQVEAYGFERICPDDIRKELTGNISDQSKNGEVWQTAFHRLKEKLDEKKIVIFDATNVNPSTQKSLETIARDKDAIVIYKIFECDKEEAKNRIRKDIEDKVDRSNVPDDVIEKMYSQFNEGVNRIRDTKVILYETKE